MLHRLIYASEAVGATGTSTLSIAQILGIAERNNRRDHVTSCLMFHQGYILQIAEGGRTDIDRLMRRLEVDPRHINLKVLVYSPIEQRAIDQAMCLCGDAATLLARIGQPCLSQITANDAEALLDIHTAA